jgi:hypothetical protein
MDHAAQQIPQPAPATGEQRYVAEVAQTAVNPAKARYRKLVDELAANAPDVGYYDVKQLRPLSNAERAVIVESNPDVVNDIALEPEHLAAIFRGDLDARLWLSWVTERVLRQWLFDDVVDECERDAEIVRQDALDPSLSDAS